VKPKNATLRVGLARALSKLGYCSRAQAAELIRAGHVRVNEKIRRDVETPVHIEKDRILVNDRRVEAGKKIYLVMNKPRGVVTTASDEKGRKTVYDVLRIAECLGSESGLVQKLQTWAAPVGRLDKASEGLLLLTNDSEWGARVTAPETHLGKTYHVQVATLANEQLLNALVRGVEGAGNNNEYLRAQRVRLLRSGQKNSWLEIVLDEGKNRQIRRMMAAFGIEVLRLVRIAIGPMQLGELAKGACRLLTAEEKLSVDRAMQSRVGKARAGAHG
jgi:23S rRNA pseudouridine2605 synthase